MKTTLRYSLGLITIIIFQKIVLGQSNLQEKKMITGKWKLEIVRDSVGNPFDISMGEGIPEYFAYLNIQTKKALLIAGNTEYKSIWRLSNDSIIFKLKDRVIRSYKLITIEQNKLVLEYSIELEHGYIKAFIHYKR